MDRAIASLAAVRAAWALYRKDYIENFVPFIATLVRRKKYREVGCSNLTGVLKDFEEEFGLVIPRHPMLTILSRATQRKLFIRKYGRLLPVEREVLNLNDALRSPF